MLFKVHRVESGMFGAKLSSRIVQQSLLNRVCGTKNYENMFLSPISHDPPRCLLSGSIGLHRTSTVTVGSQLYKSINIILDNGHRIVEIILSLLLFSLYYRGFTLLTITPKVTKPILGFKMEMSKNIHGLHEKFQPSDHRARTANYHYSLPVIW